MTLEKIEEENGDVIKFLPENTGEEEKIAKI